MRNVKIRLHFSEYDSVKKLPLSDQRLLEEARTASKNAYAVYSRFKVGAAVLLENGVIVSGNNQENASYPLGLCAERVTVFAASSQFPGVGIKAIAIVAHSDKFLVKHPVTPCGACRQAISEYETLFGKDIRIIMSGERGKILVSESIKELLPLAFDADKLKK